MIMCCTLQVVVVIPNAVTNESIDQNVLVLHLELEGRLCDQIEEYNHVTFAFEVELLVK